jgi:hypothetical protein
MDSKERPSGSVERRKNTQNGLGTLRKQCRAHEEHSEWPQKRHSKVRKLPMDATPTQIAQNTPTLNLHYSERTRKAEEHRLNSYWTQGLRMQWWNHPEYIQKTIQYSEWARSLKGHSEYDPITQNALRTEQKELESPRMNLGYSEYTQTTGRGTSVAQNTLRMHRNSFRMHSQYGLKALRVDSITQHTLSTHFDHFHNGAIMEQFGKNVLRH